MGFDLDVVDNYLSTIDNYTNIERDTPLDYTMPHWNSLFMTPNGDCEEDIHSLKPQHNIIDWNDLNKGKNDLRK